MQRFIMLALFGLVAQLVDGALGLAYGLTSTTLLVAGGTAPAIASASVHMAEVGTTFVSGLSHWKLGNTDWRAVRWLALPGGLGAFCGALVLTSISAESASTWIAAFLLCMGIYILGRFTFGWKSAQAAHRTVKGRYLGPLGLGAGFVDAAGGGGWGPIATPTLLATGRMEPRKVIGTVNTSEFLVALGASAGFWIGLQRGTIPFQIVGALLLGGMFAAPLAAWLVRRMPARILGSAVGGMIVLVNARLLLRAFDTSADVSQLVYLSVAVLWIGALAMALQAMRGEHRLQRQGAMDD